MIPIARPWLGAEELEALRDPIESRWVTRGAEVEAFERELAEAVGAPYACAVANGTVALSLALEAVGVGPGDEVVTASYSFVATANAIRRLGAFPRFADVEESTGNLTAATVEEALTPRTKAILCVHQLGMPCDLEGISRLADQRGLLLIEDAACALGSEVAVGGRWQRVGKPVGSAACFSFHPRKLLTTGEGGVVTTTDAELDRRIRSLQNHGIMDGEPRMVGYNARMSDLHAAIGRAQLRKLGAMVARRRELAERYLRLLAPLEPWVRLPEEPRWARSNWQSFAVRLDERVDRETVRRELAERGVATLGGIRCAHRTEAYGDERWSCPGDRPACSCPPGRCERLRVSERLEDHTLMLPMFHELTAQQQEEVVSAVEEALRLQRRTKR